MKHFRKYPQLEWMICLACAFFSTLVSAQTHQLTRSSDSIRLDIVDRRPISAAVQLLAEQYPMNITYEDPRYVFSEDLEETTYRGVADQGRWLVPVTESFGITLRLDSDSASMDDWAATVNEIVSAYSSRSVVGQFRVLEGLGALHIIPTTHRNEQGIVAQQSAVLDTLVSFPAQEMNGLEMFARIAEAISGAEAGSLVADVDLDQLIQLGRLPIAALSAHTGVLQADNEPVRDVFMRVLRGLDDEVAWQLFVTFEPNLENYWVNVRGLALTPSVERLVEEPRTEIDPSDSIFLTPEGKRRYQGPR